MDIQLKAGFIRSWSTYFEGYPRAVLGMFDVSARPSVPQETLTFAVPMDKLCRMIENMEESFLTTRSWGRVRERIGRSDK